MREMQLSVNIFCEITFKIVVLDEPLSWLLGLLDEGCSGWYINSANVLSSDVVPIL